MDKEFKKVSLIDFYPQMRDYGMYVALHVLWLCTRGGGVGVACCVRQESKGAFVGMRSRCWRGILLTAAVFRPQLRVLPPCSISPPPAVSISCVRPLSFDTLYLKVTLHQCGDGLHPWTVLLRAPQVLFCASWALQLLEIDSATSAEGQTGLLSQLFVL